MANDLFDRLRVLRAEAADHEARGGHVLGRAEVYDAEHVAMGPILDWSDWLAMFDPVLVRKIATWVRAEAAIARIKGGPLIAEGAIAVSDRLELWADTFEELRAIDLGAVTLP